MKYDWKLASGTDAVYNLPEKISCINPHPIIHTLLESLDLQDSELEEFLDPKIQDLHDPEFLSESKKAVEFLEKNKDKTIIVHGDFDVDGVVSSTILWDFFYNHLKIKSIPIIPNRFTEGYSLSEESIKRAKSHGADIIITVDCGIKDIEIIKKHPEIKFIITDHHTYPTNSKTGRKQSLEASNLIAIIHPEHPDGSYPFTKMCGAVVIWKFIQQAQKHFQIDDFDPFDYLPLLSLATVADIMPLVGENRIIVKHGLEKFKDIKSPGLLALLEETKIDKNNVETYHLGYLLGPRINACGRIDDAIHAVRLFSTQNLSTAKKLSSLLSKLNSQRQGMTKDLLELAENQITNIPPNSKILVIVGENWPEGILGLVAGKLNEKYHKPTIVLSKNPALNIAKGSARSPQGYNITKALDSLKELLLRYGGHAQAAGLTLNLDNLANFKEDIEKHAEKNIDIELTPSLNITAKITLDDIGENLYNTIMLLSPFGEKNRMPLFLIENTEIQNRRVLGKNQNHLKITLKDKDTQNTFPIEAIGFNLAEDFGYLEPGTKINLVGSIGQNKWNNRITYQVIIKDIKPIEQ